MRTRTHFLALCFEVEATLFLNTSLLICGAARGLTYPAKISTPPVFIRVTRGWMTRMWRQYKYLINKSILNQLRYNQQGCSLTKTVILNSQFIKLEYSYQYFPESFWLDNVIYNIDNRMDFAFAP